MNNIVEKAKAMDQFGNNLPDVEVGGAITLAEIWARLQCRRNLIVSS